MNNRNCAQNWLDKIVTTVCNICLKMTQVSGLTVYIRELFEKNCLLSSSSISMWSMIKTVTCMYRVITFLQNGV